MSNPRFNKQTAPKRGADRKPPSGPTAGKPATPPAKAGKPNGGNASRVGWGGTKFNLNAEGF